MVLQKGSRSGLDPIYGLRLTQAWTSIPTHLADEVGHRSRLSGRQPSASTSTSARNATTTASTLTRATCHHGQVPTTTPWRPQRVCNVRPRTQFKPRGPLRPTHADGGERVLRELSDVPGRPVWCSTATRICSSATKLLDSRTPQIVSSLSFCRQFCRRGLNFNLIKTSSFFHVTWLDS